MVCASLSLTDLSSSTTSLFNLRTNVEAAQVLQSSHSPLSSRTKPALQDRLLTIVSQADKLRAQQQLEQLQARYVGTGHADTTKFEWTSNIQRDSFASYVGHPPLLSYMAIGMGECREKVRAHMVEVSVAPVLGSMAKRR
jgi:splicing factor 3B subunit 5